MSGISTIINLKKKAVSEYQIKTTTRAVAHRGPNGEQYFFSKNIALGHCLNDLNINSQKSKPFDNEDITVLLDGEIFNQKEILQLLDVKAIISDSEIIAQAYARWQLNFLEHLDGKWAMVIHDKKAEHIIAIRDRFAFKPLYFATLEQHFCLVSEIKQLSYIEGWQARLNQTAAQTFLAYSRQDHTNETFFKDVNQLMGGQLLIFDLKTNSVHIESYYDLKKHTPQYIPFEKAKNEFREIIFNSIRNHLTTGVVFGSMLSGGLDSTIVTCVLKKLTEEKKNMSVEALSLVLNDQHNPLNEAHFIDLVSNYANIHTNKIIPDFSVFQKDLNDFIYFQDEPVHSDSAFAQFSVFRRASEIGIRRVFGGTGADAALAGYGKYILIYLQQLYKQAPLSMINELAGYIRYNGIWAAQYLLKKRQYKDNHFSNWLNTNFIDTKTVDYFHDAHSLYEYSLVVYQTDATVALHYDDRNASAFGIESYFPLYDRKFVELSLSLPDNYKIKNGQQKYILRETFKEMIPSEIYNRHDKKGFYNPGEDWIQQNPQWWINEMRTIILGNPTLFNPKLLTIFENFALNNKLTVSEGVFWRVFFFGKWMQKFNVQI